MSAVLMNPRPAVKTVDRNWENPAEKRGENLHAALTAITRIISAGRR